MSTTASELDEDNIQNAVVHTSRGYEWVYGLSGSLVDGRKLIPHTDDSGTLTEIVSAMGNYYGTQVDVLINQTHEVLGYASQQEKAGEIVRDHYEISQDE